MTINVEFWHLVGLLLSFLGLLFWLCQDFSIAVPKLTIRAPPKPAQSKRQSGRIGKAIQPNAVVLAACLCVAR